MVSFNLIDERWIPCVIGGTTVDLGLYETFAVAHEVVEIADPSPLVTLALHRLLLAIAHRVFGPENGEAWAELRERGRWDMNDIDHYFTEWHDRFDLFGPTHPFFQAADLEVPEDQLDAYTIALELSPSNARMFAGAARDHPPALSAGQAARALVAIQPFHRAGMVGKKHGAGPAPCAAGPLAGAAVCLLTGTSLFETLLLNMVDYSPREGLPFKAQGSDHPVWERNEPPDDLERLPVGYLDWLTWLSWVIRLVPEDAPQGPVVRRARIVRGIHLPKGEPENTFETMVGYLMDEKLGPRSLSLRRERAVWRDSAALFQRTENAAPPKTLMQISERVEEGALEAQATYPLGVYGVAFDQANALFWRLDRLPLPLAYLYDHMLYGRLVGALGLADGAARSLHLAVRVLAAHLTGVSLEGKLDGASREKLDKRAAGLGAERQYWSFLEPFFARFLVDQAAGSQIALAEWADQALSTARTSFEKAALSLPSDGESLHTQVQARGQMEGMLAKTQRDHPIPQTQRKEAV